MEQDQKDSSSVSGPKIGIFVSQSKYMLNLPNKTGIVGYKSFDGPNETNHKPQRYAKRNHEGWKAISKLGN